MKSVNATMILLALLMMLMAPLIVYYGDNLYNWRDEGDSLYYLNIIAGGFFLFCLIIIGLCIANLYYEHKRDDAGYVKYRQLRNKYEKWSNPWENKRSFEVEIEEYFMKKFAPKPEKKEIKGSMKLGPMITTPSLNKCLGCGSLIEGNFCPDCGMKIK